METSAAKSRHMLGANGPWAGRDLYRATPAVKRGLCFPVSSDGFSRLPRHTWGCRGSILTRSLTGFPVSRKMVLSLIVFHLVPHMRAENLFLTSKWNACVRACVCMRVCVCVCVCVLQLSDV
jgi:hypothetical protein